MSSPAARFTVLCDECVRIEWSPTGRFVDEPSLLAPSRPRPKRMFIADAVRGTAPVTVSTPRARVDFRPDGRPFHPANLAAQVFFAGGTDGRTLRAFWHPGDADEANLGGTLETLDGLRGPVPIGRGVLSRSGWALVDDSRGALLVDNWAAARAWRGVPDGNTDWYLFAFGHDYRAALRAMARTFGPVPVPRRCALGSWYSRYWPHSSAEYRGIVADYHAHEFPLDVMVLDMDWHSASARGEWTGWSWNRDLLPDAEELVAWMHAQGLAVTLNLHPADGVGPREDRYEAFMRAQGADPHTGERLAFDAGNRPYMNALFSQVLGPLESCARADTSELAGANGQCGGVDFWWLDWQQDRHVHSIPGLTNLAWLNHLFHEHTARSGLRGLSFSRWAGLDNGDHRRPIHFSGDAHTGWEMLAFQVPFTVAAGNAGCFFWSHDIGGHFGPRNEECAARWVWFGALSAALRLHSARTAALDRRPWTHAEPYCSAMRAAFALRATLMPLIDGAAHECESHALPLLRPAWLAHPRDERALRAHAQYTLGSDLLIAPVTCAGIGPHRVAAARLWFPRVLAAASGDESIDAWCNWFTHERHAAGTEAMVAAAIDEVPLFVPAGVPIITREFTHRPATDPVREMVVRLLPGVPGTRHTRSLHEDDGRSTNYRRGEFRRTPVTAQWDGSGDGQVALALTIGPAEGLGFDGAVESRAVTLMLAAAGIEEVRINGVPAHHAHNEAEGTWTVRLDGVRCDQKTVIESVVRPWDDREQAVRDGAARARRAALVEQSGESGQRLRSIALAAAHGIGLWAESAAPAGVGRADSVRVCDPFGAIDAPGVRIEIIDRLGAPSSAGLAVNEHGLLAEQVRPGPREASAVALPREPLSEPPVGLRASRLARALFCIAGKRHMLECVAESRARPITEFVAAGPFAWDWREPIHNQQAAPEHAASGAGVRFSALRQTHAPWVRVQGGERWPVDLRATFTGLRGMAYAATRIVSPRVQRAFLRLDCGDKIEAWLNGEKVFTQDGFDTPAAAAGGAEVVLPEGECLLLIKTSDGGGGWGFVATLEGEAAVVCECPDESSAHPFV